MTGAKTYTVFGGRILEVLKVTFRNSCGERRIILKKISMKYVFSWAL
jgi:hypothetical protein